MIRAAGLLCVTLCPTLLHSAELDGIYVLKSRGGQLVTRMHVQGQTLRGIIEVPDGAPVRLRGTASDNEARGIATSSHGNGQFRARVVGNRLDLVISQDAGPAQQAFELPLQFQRAP